MAFTIKKAKRENVYVKVALMAPSGGGKTYGSLRLATGMAEEIKRITGKEAKILLANTDCCKRFIIDNLIICNSISHKYKHSFFDCYVSTMVCFMILFANGECCKRLSNSLSANFVCFFIGGEKGIRTLGPFPTHQFSRLAS